ncbi:hypothetical protein BKA65DRAFT_402443 [Rhexocercosporidium sp. MPI-PUGE-AT-0058]|nr:hypothetical protein BKA65DRAFT_402443 [Rhexocercosporidium sp. MPI-PUGE-AT-0058]
MTAKTSRPQGRSFIFRLEKINRATFITCFLVTFSLFVLAWAFKKPPFSSEKHDVCWCGNTVAEAVSLGCHYDDVAGDWLPDKCIDHELLAEFAKAGPLPGGGWQYYKDIKGTQKIDTSNMSAYTISAGSYFATRRWHASHCLYTWRKQFRSSRLGKSIIEPYDDTEDHVIHCTRILLDQLARPDSVEWLVPGKRDPLTDHGKQGHGGEGVA